VKLLIGLVAIRLCAQSLPLGSIPNGTGGGGTPTFIQAVMTRTSGTSTSLVVPITPTAGNTLVAACLNDSSFVTCNLVTDNSGGSNTWTQADEVAGGTRPQASLYYSLGVAGTATNVTCHYSASANGPCIVFELHGVTALDPHDGTHSPPGTGTALNAGSMTTGTANEILLSACQSFSGTSNVGYLAGSGYTIPTGTYPNTGVEQNDSSFAGGAMEYQVVSSIGTFTGSMIVTGSASFSCVQAGFR
jgi:hypothetical protein